ncbi:hypothetical protein [Streptomyces triticirhizae]|uniref:Uncharacterized protein n=1 Tax=Streptomyces triticirhizae TaxID=2483353 RepID=A0A3M2LGZ9_9ACTN|nr:hypothetical protein [Streptomyces triticirhizae]RMI36787.1 hypothetical protein EBN88_20630 [Streptomyces triticirhizae]
MADRRDARELLRAAAAEHRPDRERMRERVRRGIAGAAPSRPAGRPAGVRRLLVVGAVVALGCFSLGVTALVGVWLDGGERGAAPAASAPAEVALSASGEVDPGSNPYWSQSNVTLETSHPLTALTVELRVVAEEGMRPTGGWRTLPASDFVYSTVREGGDLVFRWELRPGAEVPPGAHVFAGQYDHDAGPRSAGLDRYRITGEGPSGPVTVSGGFH